MPPRLRTPRFQQRQPYRSAPWDSLLDADALSSIESDSGSFANRKRRTTGRRDETVGVIAGINGDAVRSDRDRRKAIPSGQPPRGPHSMSTGTNNEVDDRTQAHRQAHFGMQPPTLRMAPSYPVETALLQPNEALAVLIPLLVLLSTLLLLLLLFLIMLILVRRRARIALASGDGPLDVGREEELEGAGGLDGVEERWLEMQDDATRRGYARAKDWVLSHAPGSDASEITISQFLSIQEKGVSAWSFEPDYEANSSCYVEARTEITFVADGEGMAAQEGGGCSVQSNLPLPKINEVYYWEAKMFTKPESTNISLGLATKPYPSFRMPGWSKYSVGYFSQDGFKSHNYPFAAQSYGPAYLQGDVIGVGYRPRTGTVFFTRNGKKLEDAFVGLNRYNLFPTVGSDGPAEVHINLGQAGFVFIEANVKKWGLAPMVGTLAPPPAYGQERGSILIEAAGQGPSSHPSRADNPISAAMMLGGRLTPPPPPTPPGEESPYPPGRPNAYDARGASQSSRHHISSPSSGSSRRSRRRRDGDDYAQQSNQARLTPSSAEQRGRSASSASSEGALNPPTPGNLDISLHALNSSSTSSVNTGSATPNASSLRGTAGQPRRGGSGNGSDGPMEDLAQALNSYFPALVPSSPPAYSRADSSSTNRTMAGNGEQGLPSPIRNHSHTSSSSGSLGGTAEMGNQARRSSGRTHRLAQTVFSTFAAAGNAHNGSDGTRASPVGGLPTAAAPSYEENVSTESQGSGGVVNGPASSIAAAATAGAVAVAGRLRGWLYGGAPPSSSSPSSLPAGPSSSQA
ncbi:unnamed protein product [Parajaminaea phylloscopi]